jgi:hypothetical protein
MTNPFSNIEAQLVRSSLTTKTDIELAELLERTVEEVHQFINELTGGGAQDRVSRIDEARSAVSRIQEQKAAADRRKRETRTKRQETNERRRKEMEGISISEQRQRNHAEITAQQQRKRTQEWVAKRSYKTRTIDWAVMKTVQVAKGTYVVVPKDMSEKEAIDTYYKNRDNSHRSTFQKELSDKMTNKKQKELL